MDFLNSEDNEAVVLGKTLYKNSMYFKRVRKYKCIIKYFYGDYTQHTVHHYNTIYQTIRNISNVHNYISLILNGMGYNCPVNIVKSSIMITYIEIHNA